jgi:hypothetical protein
MKPVPYKEVSKNICAILELVSQGEDVIIKNEQDRENIAVIIPYAKYRRQQNCLKKRKLGLLKGKCSFHMKDDFAITDEDLLTALH